MAVRQLPIGRVTYGNDCLGDSDAAYELVLDETRNGLCRWVLMPILFVGGCALAIFFFAMGVLKQTDAYKTALTRA